MVGYEFSHDTKKTQLLARVQNIYVPPYYNPCRHIRYINQFPRFVQLGCLLAILAIVDIVISIPLQATRYFPDWWFYLVIFLGIFGFGLWALNYAWARVLPLVEILVEYNKSEDSLSLLCSGIKYMAISKLQLVFAFAFAGLLGVGGCLTTISAFPNLPVGLIILLAIYLAFGGFISGFGMWLAYSSVKFTLILSGAKDLKLNIISPHRTIWLAALSNFMALWASLFAIQVALWSVPGALISFGLVGDTPPPLREAMLYTGGTSILLLFATIFVPIYFLVPQVILWKMVIDWKARVLRWLEEKVSIVSPDISAPSQEVITNVKDYMWLITALQSTSSSPLNILPFFRFLLSTILSIFIALLTNPNISANLLKWFVK